MTDDKKLTLGKVDPDTGEDVPHTPQEEAEAREALQGLFNGKMKLEFAPGALADLERCGLTKDELLAMLAKGLDRQN